MQLNNLYLFLFILSVTVTVSSCGDDDEMVLDRDKFLGTYSVNDDCAGGNSAYSIIISPSSNTPDDVIINGLGQQFGASLSVRATVVGDNININDTQQATNFSGSGNISGNTLSIIYTISNPNFAANCDATCIRQ